MAIAAKANTKQGFYNSVDGTVEVSSEVPRWPYSGYETPYELTGLYPIHEPTYTGTAVHLIVLDKNWVIAIFNKMQELGDEVDSLSGGSFMSNVNAWINNKNFTNRGNARDIYDDYGGIARNNIGEAQLENASYYTITSPGDANYSIGQNPSNADRQYICEDKDRLFGDVLKHNWNMYCYLQMPNALVNGETYTITTGGGDTITFDFDLDATVSRAIKINQIGYLPTAGTKKAYLGAHLYKFGVLDLAHATTYQIIDMSDGSTADSGSITLVESNPLFNPGTDDNPMYGEDVYVIDFSSFTTAGEYYIKVPGVGRSWPFKINANVYMEPFYTAVRGLYHNRAGTNLETKYTHWPRRKARMGPLYYKSDYFNWPGPGETGFPTAILPATNSWSDAAKFDIIGATTDRNEVIAEAPAGHHDAADWDQRVTHTQCAIDMMYAFQFNSGEFPDNQLNLPESGDGVPDILSECRHNLEIWRLAQDVSGGIPYLLETFTHPNINSDHTDGGLGWQGANKADYAFSRLQRWPSLFYAAAAAMYARLVLPYDPTDSALYEASAIAAYNYGKDTGNSLGYIVVDAKNERGAGTDYQMEYTELESYNDHWWCFAKCQLYLLSVATGSPTDSYITDAPTVSTLLAAMRNPYQWRFTRKDFSPWLQYSVIEVDDAGFVGLETEATTWRNWFLADGDTLVNYLDDAAYQVTKSRTDKSIGFGLSNMANYSRGLAIADQLSVLTKYRDALIQNMDYAFGSNPNGMSWTTGIGYVYPVAIQHEASEDDDITDPMPGISIYGVTNGNIRLFDGSFRDKVWIMPFDQNGAKAITTLTQTGGTATAACVGHGLSNGIRITVSGASESEYNVVAAVTVTGVDSFEYPVDPGAPATATGSPSWKFEFITDRSTQETPPMWRRYNAHPTLNVSMCEFTITETTCATIFGCAFLAKNIATTQKTPRNPSRLWGRWFLL